MGWQTLYSYKGREPIGTVGDAGWDLATTFCEEFKKLYLKELGRLPTEEEILQSVYFVFNVSGE